MTIETREWDPANYLDTEEDMISYLNAAFEDGDPAVIIAALNDVARAGGATTLSGFGDRPRIRPHEDIAAGSDPHISAVLSLANSLGFRLSVRKAGG
ncbi:helix-turn-helix domain-containing transcriptional regulator [Methylobacterium sp. JK268]